MKDELAQIFKKGIAVLAIFNKIKSQMHLLSLTVLNVDKTHSIIKRLFKNSLT